MEEKSSIFESVKNSVVGTIRGTGDVAKAVVDTVSGTLAHTIKGTGAVGTSLIEAVSDVGRAAIRGVSDIGGDVGGIPEMIVAGETGLLVPPEDSAVLADAIVTLAADPDRRRLMGAGGRQRVLDHFAIRSMVDQTAAVYRGAVSGTGR